MRILRTLAAASAGIAALSAAASLSAEPPPPSDEAVARFFDDYVARTLARLEIPGGALVVVRDGRIVLAKGYGYADLAAKRPVDVETSLFRAASTSKLLPWLLVMQLVEEGRLDLDRDVNAYLDFRIPDAFGRPITMRHLMTHSAGFPERFHGVFDQDLSQPLGRRLKDNIPPRIYAPGTTVAYSNYGAALAGYIVERLRGRPWERLAKERIFAPLGMRHATVAQPVPPPLAGRLVSNYSYASATPGEFRVTPLAPMGALTASAADMGRLLAMLANGGRGEKGRIVSPATLARMFTLQKPLGPGLPDGFGLGFLVGRYHGVRYAGHAGNMTNLATDLELLPDKGLGWYYVFNSQGAGEAGRQVRDDLLRAAIDRFAAEAPSPVRASGPSSAGDAAGPYISTRRLAGGPLMFSGLMNTTTAEAEKDGSLRIESGGAETRWLPAGRDRFVEAESGIPLAVTRGRDGKVARIASEALYPAAVFERPPLLAAWVPFVAAFSFGTFGLALLVKPVAWLIRRRRGRSMAGEASSLVSKVGRWARLSFWGLAATLAGWGLFGIAAAVDFAILFTAPAALRIGLALLTWMSLPFALVLAADALLGWRDPERGWASRSGGTLVAAAAAGMSGLFYALDVIDPLANW